MSKKINLAIEEYRDKLNASLLNTSTDLSQSIRNAKEASKEFASEVNAAANRVRDTGSWKAWMVVAFFAVALVLGFFGYRLLATQWPAYPAKVQDAIEFDRYFNRAASKATQKELDALWAKLDELVNRKDTK